MVVNPGCVGTGRKPRIQVFSRRGSYESVADDESKRAQTLLMSVKREMSIVATKPSLRFQTRSDTNQPSHLTSYKDYIVTRVKNFFGLSEIAQYDPHPVFGSNELTFIFNLLYS